MKRIIQGLGALLLIAVAGYFGIDLNQTRDGGSGSATPPAVERSGERGSLPSASSVEPELVINPGAEQIAAAARSQTSGFMVTVPGEVIKTLADDNDGSRHQRFLIKLANRQTLLVAHNIDLAPRVPLNEGEVIEVHGQYEWNDRGGVLHWTHHDPKKWREGGWIVHRGKKYE